MKILRPLAAGLLLALLLGSAAGYLGSHLGFWRHGQACAVSAASC